MTILDAGLIVLQWVFSPGATLIYGFLILIFGLVLGGHAYYSDPWDWYAPSWLVYWVIMTGYLFLFASYTVWVANVSSDGFNWS